MEGREAALDFFVASDKGQGGTESLGGRVGRFLGPDADDVVEDADLVLDGQEVPR